MDEPLNHEPTTPARGPSFLSVVGWLGLLLLAYPLSVGPVAALFPAGPSAHPLIKVVYSPLFLLVNSSDTLAAFFDWYLGLFGVR